MTQPVLSVEEVNVTYRARGQDLRAIRDLSFQVGVGEVVGVVGESGCGKSTLGLALLRLLPANGTVSAGRIIFQGTDIATLRGDALRRIRGTGIAMIFQDPLTSLNPTMKIGTQLRDAMRAHRTGSRNVRGRIVEMLEQVGIPDPGDRVDRYPHELSGGMRQRVMIAMALLLEPALIVADEPTSALDVTLQMQVIELLSELRERHGTAILFISHDLGVVSRLCDRVIMMYAGQAVEEAEIDALFDHPRHPYTKALLATTPSWRRRGEELGSIPGRVPRLYEIPAGCGFVDRCQFSQPLCRDQPPHYIGLRGERVRCHIYDPTSGYQGDATQTAGVAE